MPWYFHCKELVLTFLMFVENGFLLSCVSLPKGASQQIHLGIWRLYHFSFFYTLDFSTQDAHAKWWLGHGVFICKHHPGLKARLPLTFMPMTHLARVLDGRVSAEALASVALF